MRGKKQIAAVVLAVILAATAGIPHSTVYAEPDSTGNAQAADAAADDTKKEEKKESCQKNIPQNTPKKKPLLRRVLLILGIFAAIIFGMMSCLAPKM